ncbi:MAG: hypothetical protein C0403_04150 [Desulfobacterium sp.]|nr:hypothetical protein [Desulfobacterium sp.]
MGKVLIKRAVDIDSKRWDDYVNKHPDASPYHLFAWNKAVEKTYKYKYYSLIAEYKSAVVGVLPLIHMNLPFVFNKMVALPYCDVGNCLGNTPEIVELMLDKAVMVAKALRANLLELRGDVAPLSTTKLNKVDNNKVRMFLDLPTSSDILLKSFKSKLRSQIKKAEKNKLVFRWGHFSDLDTFYKVFAENMRDLGSPVHSKKWFKMILKFYKGNLRMGLVEHSGQLIACGIILTASDKVIVPWASTLKKYNRLSPNMLLYWNFLKYASDNGYKQFDFGRSTQGEGTYGFKAQWGAQPVPLNWYEININGRKGVKSPVNTLKRDMVATLWCKLPLNFANFFGPLIRKYISL